MNDRDDFGITHSSSRHHTWCQDYCITLNSVDHVLILSKSAMVWMNFSFSTGSSLQCWRVFLFCNFYSMQWDQGFVRVLGAEACWHSHSFWHVGIPILFNRNEFPSSLPSTRHDVLGTKNKARGIWRHKVRGTRYEERGTRYERTKNERTRGRRTRGRGTRRRKDEEQGDKRTRNERTWERGTKKTRRRGMRGQSGSREEKTMQ